MKAKVSKCAVANERKSMQSTKPKTLTMQMTDTHLPLPLLPLLLMTSPRSNQTPRTKTRTVMSLTLLSFVRQRVQESIDGEEGDSSWPVFATWVVQTTRAQSMCTKGSRSAVPPHKTRGCDQAPPFAQMGVAPASPSMAKMTLARLACCVVGCTTAMAVSLH